MRGSSVGDIVIRSATKKDLDAIDDINLRAWGEMSLWYFMEKRYGRIGGMLPDAHMAKSVRRECEADLSRFLVAELDGRVVGYATFRCDYERKVGTIAPESSGGVASPPPSSIASRRYFAGRG